MTETKSSDFGIRPLSDDLWMNRSKGGYLSGWERLGIGMKPLGEQIAAMTARGTQRLQFDFNRAYGDAPLDMNFLQQFPEAEAVQCDAFYSDSKYLEGLENLKSFRDNAYNRRGLDWSKLSSIQDLALYDCHGKFHPDYAVFEDLKSLDTANLPKKYAFVDDLPVQGVNILSISKSRLKSFKAQKPKNFPTTLATHRLRSSRTASPWCQKLFARRFISLDLMQTRRWHTARCLCSAKVVGQRWIPDLSPSPRIASRGRLPRR